MAIKAVAIADSRAAARADIEVNSEFDFAYIVMNGLAAVVACYGLFENSPAVVIGAMIIAMLLGPISGVALGLVDNNNDLLRKAFGTLAGGIGVVYVVAFVLGAIHRDFPLTRTPSPFTPKEVGSLEPRLPMPYGTTNLELRILSPSPSRPSTDTWNRPRT